MKTILIAPCGMNCNLCMAYLRDERRCPGCRDDGKYKSASCIKCVIKNCYELEKSSRKYCSSRCKKYPCRRLKQLDQRYSTKYGMSMIENLQMINESGIRKFITNETQRWVKGDKIFCVHHKKYYDIKKV